ncbi:MAG: T9SS type A sorting domain-containing protein [Candidatus Kapabacteria bacterium]|nr:T9SS type A sorting domain-containing protein [Candidatus Kapabacteria bacterium]
MSGLENQILKILGECVFSVETKNALSLQRIDVSTLPSCFYFVRLGNWVGSFVRIE